MKVFEIFVIFISRDQNVTLTANSDIDYFLVLNTDNMSWKKGRYIGIPPLNRYGSIGPHILIFGFLIKNVLTNESLNKGRWEFSRATNEPVVKSKLNK